MNPFAYNFGGTIYDKVEDPEKDIFKSIMTQRKAKYTKGHDGVFNPQNLDEKKIMWHTFFHQDWTPQPAVRTVDAFESLSEGGASGEGGDKPNENGGDSTNPETPTPGNPTDGGDNGDGKTAEPTPDTPNGGSGESGTTNEDGNGDNKDTDVPGDGGKPDGDGKQGSDGKTVGKDNENPTPAPPKEDEKP